MSINLNLVLTQLSELKVIQLCNMHAKEILSDEPKLIELYNLRAANKGHCLPIILFAKVCKGRRGCWQQQRE